MEREIINIEPRLSKKHQVEFLDFCRKLKRRLHKKSIDERSVYLLQEKGEVNKKYSGKSFHPNTDLAFMENLLIDLMLQDWEIIIKKSKIRLELEVLDDKDKNVDEEKAKTLSQALACKRCST